MEHRRVGLLAIPLLAVTLGALPSARAQAPERKTVVAGAEYQAGGFTKLWLGEDYRKVWATPVSVEVLDLQKEAGGSSPCAASGASRRRGWRSSAPTGAPTRSGASTRTPRNCSTRSTSRTRSSRRCSTC